MNATSCHDPARLHSEVGRLREVLVHRPDLSLQRLTPANCHALLFDDVLWVKKARQEHDVFVDALRERGVDVFDFGTSAGRDPGAVRGADLAARPPVTPPPVGATWLRETARLARRDAARLSSPIPDRRHRPRRAAVRAARALSAVPGAGRFRAAAAAQPALHPRHVLLDLRRRHAQPDVLAGAPRRKRPTWRRSIASTRMFARRELRHLVGRRRDRTTGIASRWKAATSCRSATAPC